MKASMHFKKKLLVSVIAAAVATAIVPTAVMAQSANATLRGKATPGANVTVFNSSTGLTRHATASADGSYVINGLPPATYKLDAGPGTEQNITLTVASTATVNIAAAEAAAPASAANATQMEGVSVAATTIEEVKTPEVGQTISLHQIATIPQASRNFLEFADTVPGMVFSVDAKGNTSLRGGAMNNSSTNVYIDGVSQKSYVKEGGVSGQSNSQGNPFPQLAIGEYKVVTSNYKAEYDQVSSAAITAETKSGTNEFHGEVFGTYTNDAFRNRTPIEKDGIKTESESKEYGFALGGPIIKDKMHFFVAFEQKKFDTPISVTPNAVGITGIENDLPDNVRSQLGSANLNFDEKLYFGKIDWELTDRDRIEVSTQVRRETQIGNIGTGIAASAGVTNENHDTRGTFKWAHSGDSWYNELIFAYENAYIAANPLNVGNGYTYTYPQDIGNNNNPTIITTGSADPRATQNKSQEGPTVSDTFTFNDLEWQGDHVVKFGYKYKSVDLKASDAAAQSPQFFYDVRPGQGTATQPWQVFYASTLPGQDGVATTTSRQYGVFAQDDWSVNDKLTLNLGVRWDYEANPAYTNFVTSQRVLDAFNAQDPYAGAAPGQTYADSLAAGGVDVNKYISNGHNRKNFRGEWQPRLGFSYDVFGDEAHVVHGGVGRAYDRNLYDYLQTEVTKQSLPQTTLRFNVPGHPCDTTSSTCVAWNPAFLDGQNTLQNYLVGGNSGQEVDLLNNKLKAPYSDQFSLGMANTIGEWQTDATVTRVLSYDGFAFTLGNRFPNGAYFNPGSGLSAGDRPVPNVGGLILGDNGIATRTTQVLLSAQKPYTKESGWSTSLAYTFSHAKQNRDINEHYSFDYPSISDYPYITSNAVSKHRFVGTAAVDLPWGISASVKLTLATPLPKDDVACYGAQFADGSTCRPIAGTPSGSKFLIGGDIWGYRDIDMQLTKDFVIDKDTKIYARFDILNVFNFTNYADYNTNWGSGGVLNDNPVSYNKKGNITYVPRTARFTLGLKF
jgi:outer membrane receptor for ferrienterochelin and colicin